MSITRTLGAGGSISGDLVKPNLVSTGLDGLTNGVTLLLSLMNFFETGGEYRI